MKLIKYLGIALGIVFLVMLVVYPLFYAFIDMITMLDARVLSILPRHMYDWYIQFKIVTLIALFVTFLFYVLGRIEDDAGYDEW